MQFREQPGEESLSLQPGEMLLSLHGGLSYSAVISQQHDGNLWPKIDLTATGVEFYFLGGKFDIVPWDAVIQLSFVPEDDPREEGNQG